MSLTIPITTVIPNGTLARGVDILWDLPRKWNVRWWLSVQKCIVFIKRATDIAIGKESLPRDARIVPLTAVVDWQAELVWRWILTKIFGS